MLNITKTVIAPYTPAQMYALVSDIENYRQYLPWCSSSKILQQAENQVIGRVDIAYLKVTTHFTTANLYSPNERIEMSLVDGPFKHLKGQWLFHPLGTKGCKIEFQLEYKFSNIFLEKLIGPVFEFVIKSIVEAFIKKAQQIYGS